MESMATARARRRDSQDGAAERLSPSVPLDAPHPTVEFVISDDVYDALIERLEVPPSPIERLRRTMAIHPCPQVSRTVSPLHVNLWDVIEIDGRLYDVVSDKQGGATLEPAITKTVAELRAEHGLRRMSREEFEEYFGDLPSDGEG
jgi:hypothetical protein